MKLFGVFFFTFRGLCAPQGLCPYAVFFSASFQSQRSEGYAHSESFAFADCVLRGGYAHTEPLFCSGGVMPIQSLFSASISQIGCRIFI